VALEQSVLHPVDAVLAGRRNNPPDARAGIRALAVYGPIHYQELPELFMDFVSSLTGKSPSTTGAGSEGALTKGPFNALSPVVDLNNALVSYMLTGDDCFTSAAGYIGPKYRVDHDISLLIPELWARMSPEEHRADYLISEGYLEQLKDFDHDGQTVLASRLGYRVTSRFVLDFFGRIFTNPDSVVPLDMLKPELQGVGDFVDGVNNIVETQQRIADHYFEDGSIDDAIPPLKALLHIMAYGEFEGKTAADPEVRDLFDRKKVRSQGWYRDRLKAKQARDVAYLENQVAYMSAFLEKETHREEAKRLGLAKHLAKAEDELSHANSSDYLAALSGTLGLDCSLEQASPARVVEGKNGS
jgi:hypothetical protein